MLYPFFKYDNPPAAATSVAKLAPQNDMQVLDFDDQIINDIFSYKSSKRSIYSSVKSSFSKGRNWRQLSIVSKDGKLLSQ